ncbi:O-linked N-acetylglucosamine transferase [Methanosarcina mazei Go1]|uniref:O-linked N-acetylglucosamine transferase n=2 Tax=Methanosarcina mazei TaxID=2209 RepID=Q8Q0V1_METMA|nr:O-linked N-acetylglucosamine transferase [Methanosarcina mazei Go1]
MVGISFVFDKISNGISSYKSIKGIEQAHKSKKIASDLREYGYKLLDCRKLEAAKDAFEEALRFDPTNPEIQMGLFKSAVFQPILTKNPTYYDAEIALKKIETILKKNPNDRHAYYFMGEIYRDSDPKKASNYYKKVISLDPKSYLTGLAYNSLAYIAATEKDNDLAFYYMKKAANLCEMNPTVLNNLSYQHLIRGQYEITIEKLTRLIKHDPYKIIVFWNIINSLRMIGKFQEAYIYNHMLIECIEDETTSYHAANLGAFFFQTDPSGDGVFFKEISGKKFYSYCSMALTCYVLDLTEEANMYLEKAQKLDCFSKASAIKFLYYNIECIQKNNVKLIYKLDDIKERLIKLDLFTNVSITVARNETQYINMAKV